MPDNKLKGYIKVFRRLQENPLWTAQKFTPGQAWIDLLLLTNHRDGWFSKRGVRVVIRRGQCGWSQQALARRWQWSQGKVNRFLKQLKMDKQIDYQKNNLTTLISILNYDYYQSNGKQTGEQTVSKRKPNGNQTGTNKNDKNEKNEKKKESVSFSARSFPYPKWLNRDLWFEFVDMRQRSRHPITSETGVKRLLSTLKKLIDDGYQQEDVIGYSLECNYRGFFPPRDPAGDMAGDGLTIAERNERQKLMQKYKLLDERDQRHAQTSERRSP